MAQGGRKGSTFKILVSLPIFLSFFHSLLLSSLFSFLFRYREEGKERMVDGEQGYRGVEGRPPASNPIASVVKWLGPLRRSKGLVS
jgi:hypothetical protein